MGYLQWHVNNSGTGSGNEMTLNNEEGPVNIYDNSHTGLRIASGHVSLATTKILTLTSNDPSNGGLRLKNLVGENSIRLFCGVEGFNNAGFSIYDEDAAVTRFSINNLGETSIPGLLRGTSANFKKVSGEIVTYDINSNANGYNTFKVNGSDVGYLQWHVNHSGTGSGNEMTLNNEEGPVNIHDNTHSGLSISGGKVGIGTTTHESDARLTVKGKIHSREVKVSVDAGADFVFAKDYPLKSLSSVAEYIAINKHLPDVVSAKEMRENGLELGEMNIKLLQKIEELTLYMIDFNKKMESLKSENDQLKSKVAKLEGTVQSLGR